MVPSVCRARAGVFGLALAALALCAAPAGYSQALLYITNGDASSLQAINVTTGQIAFSVTSSNLAYPIAVRDTIALGHRDSPGLTGYYDPTTGALIGSNQAPSNTLNWTQSVDGAVNGSFNYTFAAFFGSSTTVYRTDADWSNPVALFTLAGSTMVGITYDSSANTLWVSDAGRIRQVSLTGNVISQFSVTNGYGALAYQPTTDSIWFVPNDSSAPLVQYAKDGTVLSTLTVNGRSGNVFGAEFSVIPEPSTYALLALGLALVAWRRRRA